MEMVPPMRQILFWMHFVKIHFVYLPTKNKFCFCSVVLLNIMLKFYCVGFGFSF